MGGVANLRKHITVELAIPDSLRQQLLQFIKTFRNVVSLFVDPSDSYLFKPARCKEFRLKQYGIDHHVSCISAELCLLDVAAKPMHEAMASLTKPIRIKDKAALHNGLLEVNLSKLCRRGPPPWQKMADANADTKMLTLVQRATAKQSEPVVPMMKPFSFSLRCHMCATTRDVADTFLIRNNKWAGISCLNCKCARKASKWECECGVPWHTCTIHRKVGMACRNDKPIFFPCAQCEKSRNRGTWGECSWSPI